MGQGRELRQMGQGSPKGMAMPKAEEKKQTSILGP